jgi:hypothetical protein
MELKDRDHLIDEWLEGALERSGRAEPRPGLDNRILASLNAERERVRVRDWSWWPAWAGVAAILLIAGVALFTKTQRLEPRLMSHVTPPLVSKSLEPRVMPSARKLPVHATRRQKAAPRLEQFPSPQPLSEQEQILTRYIQQFPREAVLVAQAQTQLSKQEMMEQDTSEQNQ